MYLKVQEHLEQTLYLDESRIQFCKVVCNTIEQLQAGELYDRNHFHRLLLGRKKVGKSCLLNSLQETVKNYTNIKTVSISFQDVTNSKLPLDYVADALNLRSKWGENQKRGR